MMGKIGIWFFLLSKRLYKKFSFVVVMVLIPLCLFAFRFVAQEDSGFIHIVLAQEDSSVIASGLIESLQDSSEILHFTQAVSPEKAVEAVERAEADEAWIFPSDPDAAVQAWVKGKRDYVITVVTREQDTTLQLAREKISQVMYRSCAETYYLEYIRSELSVLDECTDRELIAYFDNAQVDDSFFAYGNPVDSAMPPPKTNYLTSPIRGLLGILVLLCGMAATMYYMEDETAGTFSYVKQNRRGILALGCTVTAVVHISVVALISLQISSLANSWLRELGILLLYALCCSAFSLLLKQIFSSIRSYGVLLPLLTVVMLGCCPVFFDFRKLRFLQLLLPPTYYVNAVYDRMYIVYMLLFLVVCLLLAWLVQNLKMVVKNRMIK